MNINLLIDLASLVSFSAVFIRVDLLNVAAQKTFCLWSSYVTYQNLNLSCRELSASTDFRACSIIRHLLRGGRG